VSEIPAEREKREMVILVVFIICMFIMFPLLKYLPQPPPFQQGSSQDTTGNVTGSPATHLTITLMYPTELKWGDNWYNPLEKTTKTFTINLNIEDDDQISVYITNGWRISKIKVAKITFHASYRGAAKDCYVEVVCLSVSKKIEFPNGYYTLTVNKEISSSTINIQVTLHVTAKPFTNPKVFARDFTVLCYVYLER